MDLDALAFPLPILLLSAALVYHWLARAIPSRIRADQAPKSQLGLVAAEGFESGSRITSKGVE